MKLQYKFIILYLAQGISLLCSIISAPIGLSYFGVEKYGLFALIWTLLTFLQMSSFGIPSTIKSYLAVYHTKDNQLKIIYKVVSLLLPICIVMLALIYLVEEEFFTLLLGNNIPEYLKDIASDTLFIASFLFIINLPVSIFLECFAGIQRIHYAKVYEVFISLSTLSALIFITKYNFDIYEFFLIRGILNLLINFFGFIHFYLIVNKVKKTRVKVQ